MKLYKKIFIIILSVVFVTLIVFSYYSFYIQRAKLKELYHGRQQYLIELFARINRLSVWDYNNEEIMLNMKAFLQLEENLVAIVIEMDSKETIIALKEDDRIEITMEEKEVIFKKVNELIRNNKILVNESLVEYDQEVIAKAILLFDETFIDRKVYEAIIRYLMEVSVLGVLLLGAGYYSLKVLVLNPLLNYQNLSNEVTSNVDKIRKKLLSGELKSDLLETAIIGRQNYTDEKLSKLKDEIGDIYHSFLSLIETINLQLKMIIDYSKSLEYKVLDRTKELEIAQVKLIEQAHKAGMAEIASSTLHNIGNAANSLLTNNDKLKNHNNSIKILSRSFEKIKEITETKYLNNDVQIESKQLKEIFEKTNQELQKKINEESDYIERVNNILSHIIEIIHLQNSYVMGSGALKEDTYLEKLTDDALEILSESIEKRKITIEKIYKSRDIIKIDKNIMIQVLINILKNSIEALDEKAYEEIINKKIIIKIRRVSNYLVTKITDNGIGFEKDIAKKMFAYKFSTKLRGSGFGLHYSANFIDSLKGRIIAYSKGKGKGASFVIILPIEQKKIV